MQEENMTHAVKYGLFTPPVFRGEKHANAKLTKMIVFKVRSLLKVGERHWEIAEKFSVCRATVSSISRGRTWSHI